MILNNKGFSLIEAIVATLLLTVMMLWSVQALMSAQGYINRATLRDEALRLSDEHMNIARNSKYGSLASVAPTDITRSIKSHTVTYSVEQVVTELIANSSKSVQIIVNWTNQGQDFSLSDTTIVGNI